MESLKGEIFMQEQTISFDIQPHPSLTTSDKIEVSKTLKTAKSFDKSVNKKLINHFGKNHIDHIKYGILAKGSKRSSLINIYLDPLKHQEDDLHARTNLDTQPPDEELYIPNQGLHTKFNIPINDFSNKSNKEVIDDFFMNYTYSSVFQVPSNIKNNGSVNDPAGINSYSMNIEWGISPMVVTSI
ncbi:hypothetical protein G9A89_005664 [Geosiphon pyriformis]|nr:hypothetical protein G9A89_005664 [Geosiphon pyriformis]